MKIAICGANGKMGKSCLDYFSHTHTCFPVNNCDTCLNKIINDVDLVIDFTNSISAYVNGVISLTHHIPIIIGSTGMSVSQKKCLKKIANKNGIGCIVSSNFSIGMLWIKRNINEISKYFDQIHIIEEHHKSKIDSPSGSALALKSIMSINDFDITSIRSDCFDVRHKILLESKHESICIEHIVKDRNAYMIQLKECIEDIHHLHSYIELE